MNAYLFTSICTVSQVRKTMRSFRETRDLQTWDGCNSLIVLEENSDKAQALFEECIRMQPSGQDPSLIEVRKIAGAQFVDQLLIEEGGQALDWGKIAEQELSHVESIPIDSFEQGYWVDVDQVVLAGKLSPNIEALRRDLPEDICAGLNWAADKQFLFVISVFSSPPAPTPDLESDESALAESQDETAEKSNPISLQELYFTYPQARDKEAAALIQARNSVVAAWLWRRHAADTRLAGNQIRIDALSDVMGLPDAEDEQD
jgi:hypothetical protein